MAAGTTDLETTTLTLPLDDGKTLPAYMARPTGTAPRPGLIVLQEVFGINPHIRDVTERFARAGYTAIAPALFHRTDPHFEIGYADMSPALPHMKAMTDASVAADLRSVYRWLTSATGGRATKVGSVGFCMGGRISFLANAELPLQAAVSFYGGGIAPGAGALFPPLVQRAPQLHAPLLLFWGGRDGHIKKEQTRAVQDALEAAGKTYTQVTFSQADHGFFCDARASYEPHAARLAWALTLAFFQDHLGA